MIGPKWRLDKVGHVWLDMEEMGPKISRGRTGFDGDAEAGIAGGCAQHP